MKLNLKELKNVPISSELGTVKAALTGTGEGDLEECGVALEARLLFLPRNVIWLAGA